jgi:hypothetical protein
MFLITYVTVKEASIAKSAVTPNSTAIESVDCDWSGMFFCLRLSAKLRASGIGMTISPFRVIQKFRGGGGSGKNRRHQFLCKKKIQIFSKNRSRSILT